jgi:hypothetical protein
MFFFPELELAADSVQKIATQGQSVTLPCQIDVSGDVKVSYIIAIHVFYE